MVYAILGMLAHVVGYVLHDIFVGFSSTEPFYLWGSLPKNHAIFLAKSSGFSF